MRPAEGAGLKGLPEMLPGQTKQGQTRAICRLGQFSILPTAMPASALPSKQAENMSFNATSLLKSPIFYAMMLILT